MTFRHTPGLLRIDQHTVLFYYLKEYKFLLMTPLSLASPLEATSIEVALDTIKKAKMSTKAAVIVTTRKVDLVLAGKDFAA